MTQIQVEGIADLRQQKAGSVIAIGRSTVTSLFVPIVEFLQKYVAHTVLHVRMFIQFNDTDIM